MVPRNETEKCWTCPRSYERTSSTASHASSPKFGPAEFHPPRLSRANVFSNVLTKVSMATSRSVPPGCAQSWSRTAIFCSRPCSSTTRGPRQTAHRHKGATLNETIRSRTDRRTVSFAHRAKSSVWWPLYLVSTACVALDMAPPQRGAHLCLCLDTSCPSH